MSRGFRIRFKAFIKNYELRMTNYELRHCERRHSRNVGRSVGKGEVMHKIFFALMLAASVVMAGMSPSVAQSAKKAVEPRFKVLSPWAEVDPIAMRGISSRLDTLAGKKIGLFSNFKRAARPIVAEVEKRLKTMYPDCEISFFDSRGANVVETETKNKEQFIAWAKRVDAVILAVGD
jgi:hypothetical protein